MLILRSIFALIRLIAGHTESRAMMPDEIDNALDKRAAEIGGGLDHRHSVVDLFKTLRMDSELISRAEVARELGYPGEFTGTAEQNEWLIRQIRQKFAEGEIK